MTKIKVKMTSTIVQEDNSETFVKAAPGEITTTDEAIRINYLEDNAIPVKMLLKKDELILKRGVDGQNYSLLRFIPGEKCPGRYVVTGRQMDLTSVTKLLKVERTGQAGKVQLEYELFNGLYLVGDYTVELIFG